MLARRYADRGPPPLPPRLYREQAVQFAELERRTRALEQEVRILRAEREAAHATSSAGMPADVFIMSRSPVIATPPYERSAARRSVHHRYEDPER